MTRYIARRVLFSLVLVWAVGSLVFLFIHILPGDPAQIILGSSETRQPTVEEVARVRERLGLDRPFLIQYGDFVASALTGDFGNSFVNNRPVSQDLGLRLGRTLQLILPAVVLSAIIGIVLGVLAAKARGGWADTLISAFGLLGLSLPGFVTGSLLVLVFAIQISLLPSSGYAPPLESPAEFLRYIALPLATLTLGGIGPVMRMTRMTMVEQSNQEYVRTARAKGMSERNVTYRHVLRNAMLPVVTVIGLQLGSRFAGTVLVETIFNWPGISSFLIGAVNNRDYPVVQGTMIVIAAIFVFINLVTDLLYAVVDPRIHYA
ncbi:MAG: ABC transporter permease [Chloroflexia bacterium]|nr:ABC transporter permease [Chloroflexia bacterium]